MMLEDQGDDVAEVRLYLRVRAAGPLSLRDMLRLDYERMDKLSTDEYVIERVPYHNVRNPMDPHR